LRASEEVTVATLREAVIVDCIRTPIGKKGGTLAKLRSDELGALVLRELVRRTGVDPAQIDDVVTGCVTQIGEQGTNIGRNIVLCSGLPVTIPGTSVNRLCASSLQAFVNAAQSVMCGFMDICVALGVESMNRVSMGSDLGGINQHLMERFAVVPQGVSAELIAEKWEFGKTANNELALVSQQRAMKALRAGEFKRETVPVSLRAEDGTPVQLDQDETPRDSTLEKLMSLQPSFKADGVITAGNSSQICDGAAGLMVTTPEMAKKLGLKPRARLVTYGVAGVCPTIMLTGPIPATQKALQKAGLKIADIDVVEINEAFSSVVLACGQDLGFDWEKTNIRGGAIALGHPLGATGAILLTKIVHLLEDRKARYGLATMCIGLGVGQTVIIERI
jgi:acetyl-CoA acetyltransferase family protein